MYLFGVLVNSILGLMVQSTPQSPLSGLETRIFASLRLRMKFKTLFMSDEEKLGHHFDWPLYFNIFKEFLAPGGFEC